MKTFFEIVVLAALLGSSRAATATPSGVFWTPVTTYTQPYLLPHLTYDTYVAERGALQNDYGLTIGVSPHEKLQGEVGFDLFLPTPGRSVGDYLQLNGKVTLVEDTLGRWQPGVSVGIANAGFKKDVSDYHLLHLDVGKTFSFGTVSAGAYYGAGSKLLWTGSGGVQRGGVLAGYISPDVVVDLPGLNKVVFSADLATGKNWFGAIGGGAILYLTPSIDLVTGPVWFLDRSLYKASYGTDFLWTFQLDVDLDLVKKKPAAPAKG